MRETVRKSAIVSLAVVLALALALTGCGGGGGSGSMPAADKPQVGGTLTLAMTADPGPLDPAKTVVDTVVSYLGAALLARDYDGKLSPWLAKDYQVSSDGLTVTFHLRDGVKFTNGEPLTAEDFKWTFERILDPKTASPVAKSFLTGVKSIEAPERLTLVLKLVSPNYALLPNLTLYGFLQPLNKKAVEGAGDKYAMNPVGVGPYKLKEMKTGEYVLLERNPDYNWGPPFAHAGPPYIQQVKLLIIPDQASQIAALESGQLSGLGIPTQQWDKYASNPKYQFFETMGAGFYFVALNTENAYLANLSFRQAMNYAVDRASIVKSVFQGHAIAANGAYHPGLPGYLKELDEKPLYPFDLPKAKQLLEGLGWKDVDGDGIREKDGKKLEFGLIVANASPFPLIAELLQAQFGAAGISVKLNTMETNAALQMLMAGKYDIALSAWVWGGADATDVMFMTMSSTQIGKGMNLGRYKSAEIDGLLAKARGDMDTQRHLQYLGDIQRHIVQNAVQIPLIYNVSASVWTQSLKGIRKSPGGMGLLMNDAYFVAPAK